MNHQDWDPVIIFKPKVEDKKGSVTSTVTKLHYNEDGEEIIKLNTLENKQTYTQMRDALKLTRAQVAQMLSVRVGIINDIENGAVVNKNVVGRYKNLLKRKVKVEDEKS